MNLLNFFKEVSKPLRDFVRPVKLGSSHEKSLVFVEVLPSDLANVIRKPLDLISQNSGSGNNPLGFESIHDAILKAEHVGLRLMSYVKPENLLFVFGETVESLQYALDAFCVLHSISPPLYDYYAPIYQEQRESQKKEKTEPRAIILCKVVEAKPLQKIVRAEQQKGCGQAKRYEVAWSELHDLHKSFCNFGSHKDLDCSTALSH
jgi:hypothetical protein